MAWRVRNWGECIIIRVAHDAVGDEEVRLVSDLPSEKRDMGVEFQRPGATMNAIGRLLVSVGNKSKDVKPAAIQVESHLFAAPYDIWALEADPFPRTYVKVERMMLGKGGGAVDVIDLFLFEDGPEAALARKAIGLTPE